MEAWEWAVWAAAASTGTGHCTPPEEPQRPATGMPRRTPSRCGLRTQLPARNVLEMRAHGGWSDAIAALLSQMKDPMAILFGGAPRCKAINRNLEAKHADPLTAKGAYHPFISKETKGWAQRFSLKQSKACGRHSRTQSPICYQRMPIVIGNSLVSAPMLTGARPLADLDLMAGESTSR